MLDRPQSLDEMCERLDLAHEEAQKLIAESKRMTLASLELLDRLCRDRAQDQELIAESQAMTLKTRELLNRLAIL